jgi:membrane protease YdiL (CAAX protease family)
MSQTIRILHAVAFLAVWMSLGWLFHLTAYTYLLTGIPLCLIFQKWVRREPLLSCWVRNSPDFHFDWTTLLLAAGFLILPVTDLVATWSQSDWSLRLYFVSAAAGAFGAAFALRHFTKVALRSLLLCLATAGVFHTALIVLIALLNHFMKHESPSGSLHPVRMLGGQFFILFPVCFMVAEVAFRGVLDSHIHHPEDSASWLSPKSWGSAALLSVLWGWWHLPILPASHSASQLIGLIIGLPMVMMVPGIAFSLFWRRTGNLAVPAFVHALIDALRNVLIGVP